MQKYDPNRLDSYAVHLANLGNDRGAVAARDIHNEDGMLLVKKGFAIKPETVQRLLNHKLVQPLETSVRLDDALSAEQLLADINYAVKADSDSWAIHRALELDGVLNQLCQSYESFPLITQKLTVLANRLRSQYDKTIYCSWFATALAVQMRLPGQAINEIFLAGLVHDMGLLHIDPKIVDKTENYTAEEWRAIQSHTLVADAFLAYVEDLSPTVRRAVKEHHERGDGTGYPACLFADALCEVGQVIAMADIVWAIAKKPARRKNHTLDDVLTIVKMNPRMTRREIERGLYHLSRHCAPAGSPAPSEHLEVSRRLLQQSRRIRAQFSAVGQLRSVLPETTSDRLVRSARLKLDSLTETVAGSGLLSDLITEWLEPRADKNMRLSADHLRELQLMYDELQWQLVQLGRVLQQMLTKSNTIGVNAKDIVRAAIDVIAKANGGVAPLEQPGRA